MIAKERKGIGIDMDDETRARYEAMLKVALAEARYGLAEGGIPIGAAIFTR